MMKFYATALFLVGSALVWKVAVQPNIFQFERLLFSNPLRLRNLHAPAPVPLLSRDETLLLVDKAAAKYRLPSAFVASIVAAESNFNCAAVSSKGAIGLMQLMPETAQQFGADPTVPAENIEAGTHYLRWLMDRYRRSRRAVQRVIAAYNAGPGTVDRYRGIPPFRETHTYVTRVMGFIKAFSASRRTSCSRC